MAASLVLRVLIGRCGRRRNIVCGCARIRVEVNCRNGNAVQWDPSLFSLPLDTLELPKVEAQANPATATAAPHTPIEPIQAPLLEMPAPGTVQRDVPTKCRARQEFSLHNRHRSHGLIVACQTMIALSLERAKLHYFRFGRPLRNFL